MYDAKAPWQSPFKGMPSVTGNYNTFIYLQNNIKTEEKEIH